MEIITVENVQFSYPDAKERTLKNIQLSVNEGEFVTIFGSSGSGKTTLLRLLKKELAPHGDMTGNIYYKGKCFDDYADNLLASEIGYVMQHPDHQIVTDKVWHELAFGLENIGIPTSEIRRRVGEMANFFGIHHWFHRDTQQLSGGQKQLLNLASIMVMQPNILILDEPTSQLDPIAASEFIHILEKINQDLGTTIILVEHNLEEVFPITDRVLLMDKGQILADEHPRKIGKLVNDIAPNHPMTEAFPTVIKIFQQLQLSEDYPITIREGKKILEKQYKNEIDRLDKIEKNNDINNPIISMKNIWFRYAKDAPDILADVNLQVSNGEILTILGGNGSGKTTLLNVLSGQYRPYYGSIMLDGKAIKKYKRKELYKDLLAVLPQDPQTVFVKSSVREDYKELSKVMGFSSEETEDKTKAILRQLDIEHLIDRHPYDVSGGEQQKIALGKLLLLQPKIIVLDEPTKGIDSFSKLKLKDVLLQLQAEGKTIIIVTHDIEFAALVSDRCGLFFDRQIIALEEPTQFFTKNNFYTTMANRLSRHLYENAITYDEVIKLCQLNGVKN